jgi:hypothetical protein
MDIIESSAHWMLKGSFRLEFLGHGGRFGRLAFNINFPRQLLYYSISSFALQVVIVSSSLLKR